MTLLTAFIVQYQLKKINIKKQKSINCYFVLPLNPLQTAKALVCNNLFEWAKAVLF